MQETREVVITPGGDEKQYWRDLWRYRELFLFIAWRDLLVRYKQTAFGAFWSVLRPLATMVVFAVIFGKLADLPSGGAPYPLFVYAAMIPWQFFAGTLSESGNSLLSNTHLLTKIYFPRLIVPAGSMAVGFADFLVSFVILILMMAWYRIAPGWRIAAIPFFVLLAFLSSAGLGLWVAALNIRYRDYRFILPFIVQYGLYVSPVGYGSSIVPEKWRFIYSLNPMVGVIDGFRWALLGGSNRIYWHGLLASTGITLLLFVLGVRYFRSTERTMADLL